MGMPSAPAVSAAPDHCGPRSGSMAAVDTKSCMLDASAGDRCGSTPQTNADSMDGRATMTEVNGVLEVQINVGEMQPADVELDVGESLVRWRIRTGAWNHVQLPGNIDPSAAVAR